MSNVVFRYAGYSFYQCNVLREHHDWEEKLMLELYKEGNPDLKYDIEERAAISECSIEEAIRMLMKN